jgi:hypothetical protein
VREDLGRIPADELVILRARAKAEDQIMERLSKDIQDSQRSKGVWELRVDDQTGDIHTMSGILGFSELYGGTR